MGTKGLCSRVHGCVLQGNAKDYRKLVRFLDFFIGGCCGLCGLLEAVASSDHPPAIEAFLSGGHLLDLCEGDEGLISGKKTIMLHEAMATNSVDSAMTLLLGGEQGTAPQHHPLPTIHAATSRPNLLPSPFN